MSKRRVWRSIGITTIVLVVVVAIATLWVLSQPQFGGDLVGARRARAEANPHYRDGAFVNPLPPASYTWDDMKSLFMGQFFGHEVREPPSAIPVVRVAPALLQPASPIPGLRAFWIGHASLYVEIDGVRLVSRKTLARATEPQNFRGRRSVIPFDMRWRLGYHGVATTRGVPRRAFGHFGFGGSGAWAEPNRKLAVALIVNSGVGTPFGDLRIWRIGGAALASADARSPRPAMRPVRALRPAAAKARAASPRRRRVASVAARSRG